MNLSVLKNLQEEILKDEMVGNRMADEIKIKMDTLKMSQLEKDLYRLAMITGSFSTYTPNYPRCLRETHFTHLRVHLENML